MLSVNSNLVETYRNLVLFFMKVKVRDADHLFKHLVVIVTPYDFVRISIVNDEMRC